MTTDDSNCVSDSTLKKLLLSIKRNQRSCLDTFFLPTYANIVESTLQTIMSLLSNKKIISLYFLSLNRNYYEQV